MEKPSYAQNPAYADFIINYNYRIQELEPFRNTDQIELVSSVYAVLYVPLTEVQGLEITAKTYQSIPKCYTYMDLEALEESGITDLQNQPYLRLRGKGTLVAVIDSGIDYMNSIFWVGDRSRIMEIWDQGILTEQDEKDQVPYGKIFTKEQIEEAYRSENPQMLVPTMDLNGHGTMLAGLAAGKDMTETGFSGAAPEASLIIVKVKQAKEYLREFYLLPDQADAYAEDDIMLAIAYVLKRAQEWKMPISICIGVGCSLGSHSGDSPLEIYVNGISRFFQCAVSVPAGNEGNARHHYYGKMNDEEEMVELRVGKPENGFVMEFWGEAFAEFQFALQSPTGEKRTISIESGEKKQELSFVFVETKIEVSYISLEIQTGKVLLFFRFIQPAVGIWKLYVKKKNKRSEFHLWLPVQGFLSNETYFLMANPEITITSPGNAAQAITMTAYEVQNKSLYLEDSRGFTTSNTIKPDLAAPGADILVPLSNGRFGRASGSSLAAAQTAGTAALLFEWAVVKKNAENLNGLAVKNYLLRGAVQNPKLTYPNTEWGYGILNLYHTFEKI